MFHNWQVLIAWLQNFKNVYVKSIQRTDVKLLKKTCFLYDTVCALMDTEPVQVASHGVISSRKTFFVFVLPLKSPYLR